jgi:LemA protein
MTIANQQDFAQATDLAGRAINSTNFLLDNWWVWLVLGLLLWGLLKIRSLHELLGQMDERCEAAFADIDALLTERHGLIGNLVETVKGFASQEHKVLNDVTNARSRAMAASGSDKAEAESQVGRSLATLYEVTENYPELTSSAHFTDLRNEIVRMDDQITASRRFYNLSVEELNGTRRAFPANVVDYFFTVGSHEKYSIGDKRTELSNAPQISFS